MDPEINRLYLVAFGAVLLVIIVALELFYPERDYDPKLKQRSYLANILMFSFNNVVLFAFQLTAIYLLAYQYRLHDTFDLIPFWLQVPLGVLLLDFTVWCWHLLAHKVTFLWEFHKCHHSEQYLNATSAVRFHTGELILSAVFKAAMLAVFGISFWIFILYESLITFFAIFHHANFHMPHRFQAYLSYFIITPDMHRTHHSALRDEHDSNYGVIFSWWDRLLGTFQSVQPTDIGLRGVEEKSFFQILTYPFRK